MFTRHLPYWPKGLPYSLPLPATSLYRNNAMTAGAAAWTTDCALPCKSLRKSAKQSGRILS